jgi:hypothetical protein
MFSGEMYVKNQQPPKSTDNQFIFSQNTEEWFDKMGPINLDLFCRKKFSGNSQSRNP